MVRDPTSRAVRADGTDDALVKVRTRDDAGNESEPLEVRPGGRNITTMDQPVVADGHVFLTASKILRVNLETDKKLDRRGIAFPVKGGVGYVSTNQQDWEIGRLDPKTLALQPQITRPDDCAAIVARRGSNRRAMRRCRGARGSTLGSTRSGGRCWSLMRRAADDRRA